MCTSLATFVYIYDTSEVFFTEFKNGLLGAWAVIIATAALLFFEDNLRSNNEKQKVIYLKKLEFYQEVARTFKQMIISDNITKNQYYEFKALRFEMILICGIKSLKLYDQMLSKMAEVFSNDKLELSPEIEQSILSLFHEFSLELLQESGKSVAKIEDIRKELDLAEDEYFEITEKEKKNFRSDQEKFNIIKDFVSTPNTIENLNELEKKYNIKDLKVRLPLFIKQFREAPELKEYLIKLNISLDSKEIPAMGSFSGMKNVYIEPIIQTKRKKVRRSNQEKFNIIKDFVSTPDTLDNLKELEKKHKINDLRHRLPLFIKQLKKSPEYREQLIKLNISIDDNNVPEMGSYNQ